MFIIIIDKGNKRTEITKSNKKVVKKMWEKIESAENINGGKINLYYHSIHNIFAAVDNETGEIIKEFNSYDIAVCALIRRGYRF